MAKTELAVAELIWNLIAGKTENVGRVTYSPQKPPFPGEGAVAKAYGDRTAAAGAGKTEGMREVPAVGQECCAAEGPAADQECCVAEIPAAGQECLAAESPAAGQGACMELSLERATPESQGISSAYLADFLRELSRAQKTDIHQVLITRGGKVICECGFAPYPAGLWHTSYSMCKSVTGMAIGMLIDEGKLALTDRVIDFFKKRRLLDVLRQKDITVENLLTMTSCIGYDETGIVAGDDWVKGFLEAGLAGTPGKDFQYNSMNSYMLSAIVTEVTGESMMEYLRPRLWEPLGISRVFWEACPMGITKGGWGLFIRPEDAAKLGELYIQGGQWNGRQLVSRQWVEASCMQHVAETEPMSPYGYGYQMWMTGRKGGFNYNGMLGQNVVAYPDLDMVIVTNAGSRELYQSCELMALVGRYFEGDFAPEQTLPEDPAARAKLSRLIHELECGEREETATLCGGWPRRLSGPASRRIRRAPERQELIRLLSGRLYELEEARVGLMPLFMQVLHNNYTDGISRIGFLACGNRLFVDLYEGEAVFHMQIGFAKAAVCDVDFHGECYRIGVKGAFAADEEGRLVLKLDFAFLEEACRRKLKLYFEGDELEARWEETPGREVILEGLDAFTDTEGRMGFLMNAVRESGGIDVFHILAERTIQPVCRGRLVSGGRQEA